MFISILGLQLKLLSIPKSNSDDSGFDSAGAGGSFLKLGPEPPELLEPKYELSSEECSFDLETETEADSTLSEFEVFDCFPFLGFLGTGTSSC